MKKLSVILLLSALLMNIRIFAKNRGCAFRGAINGIKVKSFRCEIERAGVMPYLLFGVKFKGHYYMVDLKGITFETGRKRFSIKLMKLKNGKVVSIFKGKSYGHVRKVKSRYRGVRLQFELKNRRNEILRLNGIFMWDSRPLKTIKKTGLFVLKFSGKTAKKNNVKLTRWSNGFKINAIIIVKRGETINASIFFPSNKPGVYRGKNVKARIMHMVFKKRLSSKLWKSLSCVVRVKTSGKSLRVFFSGIAKYKNRKMRFNGYYRN